MVCPLRFVIAAASVVVILLSLRYYVVGEEPEFLRAETHRQRTWWRFVVTLFTGELLRDAWYGVGAAGAEDDERQACGGGGKAAPEKEE